MAPDYTRPAPPADGYEWYPDVFEPHKTVVEEMFLTSGNGLQIYALTDEELYMYVVEASMMDF